MLAGLHWNGGDVTRDRTEAHACMDLAAERGQPLLTLHRERYWAAVDERAPALEVGAGLYAGYGDHVANPLLDQHLKDRLQRRSGSRLGGHGVVRVNTALRSNPGGGGGVLGLKRGPNSANGSFVIHCAGIELQGCHDDKYWNPKDYWQWQDEIHGQSPTGIVTVGSMAPENCAPVNPAAREQHWLGPRHPRAIASIRCNRRNRSKEAASHPALAA